MPYFGPSHAISLLNTGKLLPKRSDSVSFSIKRLSQAFSGKKKKEHGLKLALFMKIGQNQEKIMEVADFD